jgi:hypothetical protein
MRMLNAECLRLNPLNGSMPERFGVEHSLLRAARRAKGALFVAHLRWDFANAVFELGILFLLHHHFRIR